MRISTEAIIALVGIILALPSVLVIAWKCLRLRREVPLNRTNSEWSHPSVELNEMGQHPTTPARSSPARSSPGRTAIYMLVEGGPSANHNIVFSHAPCPANTGFGTTAPLAEAARPLLLDEPS
ncbi:hypothetical protein F4780DRAFT_164055 [Xylariomycetidae sp. FL0641]|nr:hypothetical protein F4780DRAFT_164055 [Xylariomycetidae sp. FL0641]